MVYQAKDFKNLLGSKGFSDQLLNNHFTLYQGYVSNINKLMELLNDLLDSDKATVPEFAELKRRFGWEFNGMRLHELYFENMAKDVIVLKEDTKLHKKIKDDFGSLENWQKDFISTGSMRGIGWVVLYFDPVLKKLFNVWINEHDLGHLSGAIPLLVMDVFEHAYMLDYGIKKPDYIQAFLDSINWQVVLKRY